MKMSKNRPLNEDEKKFTEKNLAKAKSELEYLDYQIRYRELMINDGLQQNFNHQMIKMKNELSKIRKDIEELQFGIKVSEDQLKNGVKPKNTEVKK